MLTYCTKICITRNVLITLIYRDLQDLLRHINDKSIKQSEIFDEIITTHLESNGVVLPNSKSGNTIDSTSYVEVEYDERKLLNPYMRHTTYWYYN